MPQTPLATTLFTLAQSYRVTVRAAINAKQLGLNALHVRCLHLIADTPQCTANDIVNKTQRDKAQIARLLKELLSLALISKCADQHDKRCFILSLTDAGKQLFTQLNAAEQQVDSQLCQGLSQAQIDSFLTVANMMIRNINNE
ncbi:MarR family winged helix-turn-helix transcriptional regulator [Pseudoalteromonas mariniglutinosa]|uniref:MarR family winged helix-turn-helix transcriptional regulator n=1 Tax=Pseudoalteromonas mariniglutinosa TaxID=206042 RepID=UPI00384AEB71